MIPIGDGIDLLPTPSPIGITYWKSICLELGDGIDLLPTHYRSYIEMLFETPIGMLEINLVIPIFKQIDLQHSRGDGNNRRRCLEAALKHCPNDVSSNLLLLVDGAV